MGGFGSRVFQQELEGIGVIRLEYCVGSVRSFYLIGNRERLTSPAYPDQHGDAD